jgi:zinc-ribbon domain
MRLFKCQSCGQLLYFENRTCENCLRRLGYLPEKAGHPGPLRSGTSTQVNLVILLVYEDLPDQFSHGKFAERVALPNPGSIIPDSLIFVLQIESEHFLGVFRSPNGRRHELRRFLGIWGRLLSVAVVPFDL